MRTSCCQKPVDSNFTYCPECGTRIHPVCEQCHTPVERGWNVCPNCGKKLNFKNE
ncbi:MAG: double zinc ribbon domain-containing protein [Candidatus Aminicenantaceae bacterium]